MAEKENPTPQLPEIAIEIVNILGEGECSRKFQVGEEFHYPADRGKMCPAAIYVMRPYLTTLSFGGSNIYNPEDPDSFSISCPDAKHPVVYKMKRQKPE